MCGSELPRIPVHSHDLAVARLSTSPFSARVQRLAPSATLALVQKVREMRAAGIEVLALTAGEPDFAPPRAAEEAAMQAIREGQGRYTSAAGTAELRETVVEHIQEDIGLSYAASEIVVTNGAKIGIAQALMALVEAGDEVLLPSPCWTSYPEIVQLADATPVLVPCNAEFEPDLAALEAARTPQTRAILLNTPNNPTGAVYSEASLRALGEWALEHEIAVISDEIYASLTFDGAVHRSPLAVVPELRETSVWIGGMSKAYAMTGWRMGFVATYEALAKKIGALQSQLAGSPNAISQIASVAAIREGAAEREAMRAAFEKRSHLVVEALRAMPGLQCAMPSGAFYAFPRLGEHLGKVDPETGICIESGDDFARVLLEADRVACIGGTAFAQPDAFRISFAASEEVLLDAMHRIAQRLTRLETRPTR